MLLRTFCIQQRSSSASPQLRWNSSKLTTSYAVDIFPCQHSSPSTSEHVLDTVSGYSAIHIVQTSRCHRQTYLWQLASRDEKTSKALGEGPLDLPPVTNLPPPKRLHVARSLLSLRQIGLLRQPPWFSRWIEHTNLIKGNRNQYLECRSSNNAEVARDAAALLQ